MKSTRSLYIILIFILFYGGCKKQPATQKSAGFAQATLRLCQAVREGNLDQVRDMVKKGVDINARDVNGFTPVHYAAKGGHKEVSKFLISKGAQVTRKTGKGLNKKTISNHGIRRSGPSIRRFVEETDVSC